MGMGFRGREASRFRSCVTSWCLVVSQSRDLVASFSICKLILHSYLIKTVIGCQPSVFTTDNSLL